jgi:L-threonylcarbamoyladenylate synthase
VQKYIFFLIFANCKLIDEAMEEEITKCVDLLRSGKVILYPTDTVWGIGCDATNEDALNRLYVIKHRQINKSMLILLDRAEKLPLYVEKIPLIAWDLLNITNRPTTYIYPTAKNLPSSLIHPDGSIAIRIVQDLFCKKLVQKLNKPLVSTSANLSGFQNPLSFAEIDRNILDEVDYVVPEKYAASTEFKPSRLIKFVNNYNFSVIRE